MVKSKGGRGKYLPYEQTHVRVPLPVKEQVQRIIDNYRAIALGGETDDDRSKPDSLEVNAALNLLQQFIHEADIEPESYEKPTRDNRNLNRFQQWLIEQL